MKIMLVFHYSDHFADPLCQDIPEQWSGASAKEIEKYVYDYTYYIMNFLGENGITPEWVQVGNEMCIRDRGNIEQERGTHLYHTKQGELP